MITYEDVMHHNTFIGVFCNMYSLLTAIKCYVIKTTIHISITSIYLSCRKVETKADVIFQQAKIHVRIAKHNNVNVPQIPLGQLMSKTAPPLFRIRGI